ncbi:MAG: hypothetical protein K8Q91_00335 [Candidatus Vogelbacteria bacterium]|nr:hypothetical protein [Candidatus Vogelbacteria bacterium]
MERQSFDQVQESSNELENFSFEKTEHKEGVVIYFFKNVAVAIDTTGKNQPDLPEILFGTFADPSQLNENSFDKPVDRLEGVNMEYITKCIKMVAEDSGIEKFWFFPSGKDALEEREEQRRLARVRLFSRYAKVTPSENGFGYVLEV